MNVGIRPAGLSFVMTDEGHFPPVHPSHEIKDYDRASVNVCAVCGCHTTERLLAPCVMADAWKLGETYLYQEPEPVDRWPTPTRWGRLRARIRMWYRRLCGQEYRL